ncbi:MAG: Flagellar biosynthesis protein FliS [Firmicutes bacterium]|nr:Flagellar biosynthesis protein FliS [Bacillota bacterium]MDI6707235.1 flagellar export chaperone FliS [Bacillota bacterium]
MAMQNPYQSYKQNCVTTVTPEELVVLVYKGLEKYLRQGIIFVEQNDVEKANNAILKAQDIINELMSSLDMNIDMSQQLYSLYDFMRSNLIQANVRKDPNKIREVLDIAAGLRESWEKALLQVRQLKYGK